ncbi:MAG: YlmC/YmxH family sporulation protein [Clostridia bacterium]|nr:YlmC/YmxH family sporulation protein [Clostridia bacterium]
MLAKVSDLQEREIVNIVDGRRLGPIKDIDIDIETGKITAIILPGEGKFLNIFGRREDYIVPWEKIVRIGVDVILVEAQPYTEIPRKERSDGEWIR